MKSLLLLFICISSLSSIAQNEANNWYFGRNAGITFNTNPPSPVFDGQLNTLEGCSSISDVNGNLLMYTDGRTIWNRNHEIMSNADYFGGTGLYGDPSSTSSGLIVPHPSDPDLYYIFTVDEPHHDNANAYPNQGPADSDGNSIPFYTDIISHYVPEDDDGFNNGLNYSIVDMSLNGGLGDVITGERNNELITYDVNDPEEIKYKCSEKITAVSGRNCISVWLITHFRNKFYAFYIDENGLNETPVISTVEPLVETTGYRRAALGYLKASPNANKLVSANNTINYDPIMGVGDFGDGNVYVYDFNNLTGEVTNPIKLIENVNTYGVEFSQDGTKVYATIDDPFPKLNQWNLEATDVVGSMNTIANFFFVESAALQLAPNGKIYHSIVNSDVLGVINNPNETGEAVNFTRNITEGAILLDPAISSYGLPPFIQSLFQERIPIIPSPDNEIIEQIEFCDAYTFQLGYEDIPGATYTWFKEGVLLPNETSPTLTIIQDPAADFPIVENYRLEVDLNTGECPLIGIAKITFKQSPNFVDDELITCQEEGQNAVYDLTEIQTKLMQQVTIDADAFETEIYRDLTDAELGIDPIELTSNYENTEELESLIVKISTQEICEKYVEFSLTNRLFPDINTETQNVIYCTADFPQTISISPLSENEDPSLYDYLWSTGETTSSIAINAGGSYSVEIRFAGEDCPVAKSFDVLESTPVFNTETVELCDTFEYTITQDDIPDGTLRWYENGNRIPGETNPDLNLSFSENLDYPVSKTYVLEVDKEDGSCLTTYQYNLNLYKNPDYNDVVLEACNDLELDYATFNLVNSLSILINGLSGVTANQISVAFYTSRADALNEENEIEDSQNFENTSNLDRVFAVITSNNNPCQTLEEIELVTFRFQNTNSEKEILTYCLEDFPETLELNALIDETIPNSYNYFWSTSETTASIEINQAGIYTVEVSSSLSACSFVKEFEVIESNLANFEVIIEESANLNTLEVIVDSSSIGNYQFALNSTTNFQDSNFFENLDPGIYMVFVRDQLGCGIAQKKVSVLGIMDFFTPNGDGINDFWEILGIQNYNQDEIQVEIYDRYGKLLKIFTNQNYRWDGTYNGKKMPSDDYWFRVSFPDGRLKTGNFTLKR